MLKKYFGGVEAGVEIDKCRNAVALSRYVQKKETRANGPWFFLNQDLLAEKQAKKELRLSAADLM